MRRRLLVGAGLAAIVAVLGAVAAFSLGPVSEPTLWAAALAVTILGAVAFVLLAVFALVLPRFGSAASHTPLRELRDAVAAGRDGFARVLSATSTGAQLNGAWAYDVELVVDGTAVAAYRTRDRVRVHRREGRCAAVRSWPSCDRMPTRLGWS